MAGLLGSGWDDPQSQGIMALASGLLGGDFAGGIKGYGDTMSAAKDKAFARRMKEMELENMQGEMGDKQQQRLQAQKMQALIGQFAPKPGLSPLMGDTQSGILPSAGKPSSGFDYSGYANALAGVDPIKALALQQSLQKESTINKLDVKDFTPASVAKYSMTKNYGDLERMDKAHFANTGGQTTAMNPFTGLPLNSIANTQSPDSKASNAVAWANHGLAKTRDALAASEGGKPQLVDGQWVYKPTSENPQGRVVNAAGMHDRPLNESQGAATNFGNRAMKAHEIISSLENSGGGQPGSIKRFMTAATPGLGMGLDESMGTMTNWTQSSSQQKAEQAQRNFITAVLRKESGASISPGEYSTAAQIYFPQPNDDAATRLQKQRTRDDAIQGLKMQAGPGAKNIQPSTKAFSGASNSGVKFLGFEGQ